MYIVLAHAGCASGGGHPERREAPLAMPQSEWRSKNEVRDLRRRKPIRKMARKRAQQRWSALLVRISRQVQLEGSGPALSRMQTGSTSPPSLRRLKKLLYWHASGQWVALRAVSASTSRQVTRSPSSVCCT